MSVFVAVVVAAAAAVVVPVGSNRTLGREPSGLNSLPWPLSALCRLWELCRLRSRTGHT